MIEGNKMNKLDHVIRQLKWLSGLLMVTFIAGCGGGGGGGAPILGGGTGTLTAATLVDVIKPRVTVTVPVNASITQPSNAAITATFTEAMTSATLVSPAISFMLVDNAVSGTLLGGNVSYVAASKAASFKPTLALTAGHIYTATIKGIGAGPATDVAGNPLAGNQAALPAASDYIWTFTAAAADLIAPTVTLAYPANLATNVAINTSVNATFSKAMDATTICGPANTSVTCPVASFTLTPAVPGVVSYDPVSFIATFNPTGNLAANTTYTATVTNTVTDLAANALLVPAVGVPANPWTFTTGTGLAPGAINLGSASTFGLMATAAITAATASIINGDVSLEPGTSMTGFPPAVVNGAIHINDTVSHQARADLLAAYNQAKALACTTNVGTGDLGGLYVFPTGIPPGVYCSGSTMLVGAHLVLDAGGNANAVWVFQIGSSLTTGADVTLTGGAQAKNVFWVPTFDVTIGSGTIFNGTIVAGRSATSAGSATLNGQILAGATTTGTIALNGPPSSVNVPLP
jgi:hypothetical protein